MALRRQHWLGWLVMLVAAGCTQAPEETAAPARPPNIVFILADDLGYGDLGCYGQQQIQTPNLDRLAAEGVRFTQFYAGSTVCAPSRCVLMTGKHVGRVEIRGNRLIPLSPETLTVAEMLQDAGYATGLIGKWGLGEPGSTGEPRKQGFDYFFGYLNQRHAHNYYTEFLFRNEERVPIEGNRVAEPTSSGAGVAVERSRYSHDLFTQEALEFIAGHNNTPFFLYLAYTIPHANNEAAEKGMEVPDYGIYADREWPEPQKGLAAMITRMDRDVGRLLEQLKTYGIDEQTIVFFSSDNGPHAEGGNDPDFFNSNGPLRGIKRDLYEGGIRVPMVVRWAGHAPAGRVSHHVGYFGDFLATAAELAGVTPPEDLDSLSFLPEILDESERQEQHRYLYWEFYERGSAQAVRHGNWKGIRQPMFTGKMELYDLSEDIGEQYDLSKGHPEVVKELESLMEEAHHPSAEWQVPGS